jgi:hypothetical protein
MNAPGGIETGSGSQTFRDRHREIQELVRELAVVRNHNLKFKEGEPQDTMLLFAEAALVLVTLERFVRAVLGSHATDRDTLPNLLQKAVKHGLLQVPWDDQQDGIRRITSVRNALLHGNYEQSARQESCSVEDFFKKKFAGEVESLTHVVDNLMSQIDPATGRPYGRGGGEP